MTSEQRDQWAQWILQRRHGSDPETLRQQLALLAVVRDKVLTNAAIEPGHAVLDIGCGDGLIGFAAAETSITQMNSMSPSPSMNPRPKSTPTGTAS